MNLHKSLLTTLLLTFTLTACSDPDRSPNPTNNSDTIQDTSLQDTSLQDTNTSQDILEDTSADTSHDTDTTPELPQFAGTLDDTFAPTAQTPGIFTGPQHLRSDGSTLNLDTSGNILVAGRGRLTPQNQPADFPKMFTLQLNDTGELNPVFGENGLTTLALGPETQNITVLATTLQPDNKIVTCGNLHGAQMGRAHLVITRQNPDGTPDPTFGNTPQTPQHLPGIATFDIPTDKPNSLCWTLHILDDGKILAAGQIGANSTMIPLLMRLNPDGTLDSTFGNDPETPGITLHDIAPDETFLYAQIREFTVLPNNQILALIHSTDLIQNHQNGYLLRFNADGTLDENFELVTLELPDQASHEVIDFTVHPTTNQFFITGRVYTPDPDIPFQAFVHALTADAQPDPQFPTYIHPELYAATRSILIQPDGKIVAAGSSITHQNADFEAGDLLVLRLNLDGQLDPTFAADSPTPGVFTHQNPNLLFYTARALLDTENRLVLTGSTPVDNEQSPRGHTFITRLR